MMSCEKDGVPTSPKLRKYFPLRQMSGRKHTALRIGICRCTKLVTIASAAFTVEGSSCECVFAADLSGLNSFAALLHKH